MGKRTGDTPEDEKSFGSFKDLKVSMCNNAKTKEEMEKLVNENDVLFIFPHQLKFFNDKFFNISIAIDCLHEMEQKTIKKYMWARHHICITGLEHMCHTCLMGLITIALGRRTIIKNILLSIILSVIVLKVKS